jgi:hypothetical protein
MPTFRNNPLYVKQNIQYCSAFKIGSVGFSEMLRCIYQTTRRVISNSCLGCQKNKNMDIFAEKCLQAYFKQRKTKLLCGRARVHVVRKNSSRASSVSNIRTPSGIVSVVEATPKSCTDSTASCLIFSQY